uniref:tRNA/rRNA methyltransferase SpoU type domain-containing protein n=1 Tax=Plectus sambesii TaxID=2011161 RepID=A0A914WSI1_9BILA
MSGGRLPLIAILDGIRGAANVSSVLRTLVAVGCSKVLTTAGTVDTTSERVVRESLNAASKLPLLGRLSWDAVSQHVPQGSKKFKSFSVYLCDSAMDTEWTSRGSAENERRSKKALPLADYASVDYTDGLPAVLVLGSEAAGLSDAAYDLARRHNGIRVHIPLSAGVESLNLAAAAAVIAFEIRQQLLTSTAAVHN